MDQKITITIAERKYSLSASSPENETLLRTAAEWINKRLEHLNASIPGKSDLDKMTLIALNMAFGTLSLQKELDAVKSETGQLLKDTENYLDKIAE